MRTRIVRRAAVAILIVAIGYFGYMGWDGSNRLVNGYDPNDDCRTPAQLGITYEAINYDIAADVELAAREPNMSECSAQGPAPGDKLVASDGVRLAGWYIPAANGAGPDAATVVMAHGWNDNKSGLLENLPSFHDRYNVVMFDFRNHGQSQRSRTTQGIHEQRDLVAVLDWLEATRGPHTIVLWGQSMGGHTAVNVAADDLPVDALILEVTHSRLQVPMINRIRGEGYPFGEVGYLAIWVGSWLRAGVDVFGDDPITAIDDLGTRPVLILAAGADTTIPLSDAEQLRDVAVAAGVSVTLEVCEAAGHESLNEACDAEYRRWVDRFLGEVVDEGR